MPVYSSHLLRYEELRLGDRIRGARERRGLTLKQLATQMESSAARLSQIENDRLRLDLDDVVALARALDLPLDEFVPPDLSLPYQIARDAEVRRRPGRHTLLSAPDENGPVQLRHAFWPLADLFVGRHLEPMLGLIEPMETSDLQFCSYNEEAFVFALRGRIEFRIRTPQGECCEELGRGDCVYFRSRLPHSFRSLDAEPAESLHVFCSPSASREAGIDGTSYRAIAVRQGDRSASLHSQVGEQLRLLRETHGWTVERVAEAAGLGERQLQRIERGERSIPLDAVLRLARAFGKPVRELIGLTIGSEPHYVVQRSTEIPSIPSRRRRTPVERPSVPASKTCQPLVDGFRGRGMYPCFIRLLNVDLDSLTLHEHHGQEFIYVLEGELELTTYTGEQEVREVLRAGDACYVDSTVPHLLRSWTRNPYSETSAEVIDVFWCPLGESYLFHG
jgi:transcriptional regulator with XRE-family HTH domain